MKNKLLHSSLLYVTVNHTQSCTALMYVLQVKFDFRLILIQSRSILNCLCFLTLIHEFVGLGDEGNWESTLVKKFNLKSNMHTHCIHICTSSDLNNTVLITVAVNLMNTVLKRSRKFRIAQNCKIIQTVQLTLASLQTPFSLSDLPFAPCIHANKW